MPEPSAPNTPPAAPDAQPTPAAAAPTMASLPPEQVGTVVDEDLSGLPRPRRRRHPIMMVLVMAFSGVLMWMYWEDVEYFLQPSEPQELGSSLEFQDRYQADPKFDPNFPENRHVRLSGLTGLRTTANERQWTFMKLAFVPVYVQLGPKHSAQIAPDEDAIFLTVRGRLRRIAATSRFDQLQQYYRQRFGVSFNNAYILEAGVEPRSLWWAPALFALFIVFILVNGVLLVRRLRRD